MPIPRSYPIRFTPKGLCDAFDATDAFAGACMSLSNLVFDQANPEVVISRPGVGNPITSFAGFTTPGFVSVHTVIGTRVFGMVATGRNAGFDEPFCFDTATGLFVTITGVVAGNVPTSPATSGAWTPPTMAVIGIKIIITHPGFSGAGANFFGVIDLTNPAAPAWSSSNTATNPLTAVPTAVANFNNRAYFAVANTLQYSDVLNPVVRTNASQSITLSDTTAITALSGLPISTTSTGVVGALVAWKATQIWQITGDAVTNNLALNYITLTTGTVSPRSIVQTPYGIVFAAPDGPYVLNFVGQLGVLSNTPGQGGVADVQLPFQNASTPSRMAASFAGNVYRVNFDTNVNGQAVTNDYWYDTHRRRWNGPHTFAYDCASQIGGKFILSSAALPGKLFSSEPIPSLTTVYNDVGLSISIMAQSSSLPKVGHMTEKQVVESTIELSSSGVAVAYLIRGLDERSNLLASGTTLTTSAGKLWGSNIWGDGSLWQSSVNAPHVYTIPWNQPLVFKKFVIQVTATATTNLKIGTFFARYQDTGYTNQG